MPTLHRYFHRSFSSAISVQFIASLCVLVLVTGCSSSGSSNDKSPASDDSNPTQSTTTNDMETSNEAPAINDTATTNDTETISDTSATNVTFDITVPAYSSNALQVRLQWDDKDLNASWVEDESWAVTDEFSNQSEFPLTVSFNDNNGAVTLASFTTKFKADSAASQVYKISADQFNSKQWDNDEDGVSNLEEAIAGDNPLGSNVPESVQASLELVPDKAFQFTWEQSESAEYYRVLENPDGLSGFTQVGEDIDSATLIYKHRVALYSRVNASYIVQACNDAGCSDSSTMTVPSSLESAITYIKASNAEISDAFGVAVSLNHDGTMLAIGAVNEDSASNEINGDQNDNEASASGAVYVFKRVNDAWQQQAYLKASNARSADRFGTALAFSADGNTLAVGANKEGGNYGAVYIFKYRNGEWFQHAYIKPTSLLYSVEFGSVLSLSDDGNTLAVGTGGNYIRTGVAYLFVQSNDTWTQQASLKGRYADGGWYNEDGELMGGDFFGHSLSLSGDGNTLAVGARGESSNAQGIGGAQDNNLARNSGAVYTFTRNGNDWQQKAFIKSSNSESWDAFGNSVSISGDGNTLAVYASGEDSGATTINGDQEDNSARNSGAIYLFSQAGGAWKQEAYIKSATDWPLYKTMESDSLSDNGTVLAVGNNVYAYRDSAWQLQVNLQSISGSEKVYNGFPVISGDGKTIAIGDVTEESSDTGINGDRYDYFGKYSGAVYLY